MEQHQPDAPPLNEAAARDEQISRLMRENAELTQQVNELTRRVHDQELREALGTLESQRPRRRPVTPHPWGLPTVQVDPEDVPPARAP